MTMQTSNSGLAPRQYDRHPAPAAKRYLGLSIYGWTFWLPILMFGLLTLATLAVLACSVQTFRGLYWTLFTLVAIVVLAALAFFRDPMREVPADAGIMVSPADGTVTEITPMNNVGSLTGPVIRLGIFLSVLDVHLNRAPCEGTVLQSTFRVGRFYDARNPQSSTHNQSNTLVLGDPVSGAPIAIVKQIVGAIARRIITPLSPGQSLSRGQRFGMIAFGSRTELYLPADQWVFTVQVGQKLKAGQDIVARKVV